MKIPFLGIEISQIKRNTPYVDATKGFMGINFGQVGRTPVTEKTAFSLSAYYAGVRRISESIAMLPIDVIKREGERRVQTTHPTEYLLNSEANNQSVSFDFRQILTTSAINTGNGLAIIERDRNAVPTSLVNVRSDNCKPVIDDGEVFWKVKVDNSTTLMVNDRDMINIRGFGTDPIIGLSVIEYHRQNLGLSIAAQDYGEDFYNKGTRIDGYIKYEGKLDREVKGNIADQWRANYGPNGKRGVAILDNNSSYTPLGNSVSPADAQFIETRKFQKNEIATILGLPPHMINEMEDATFSNIEHQGIEYVTFTLSGWLAKFEQEYRRKLLRRIEKPDHYYKHNVNMLLRADVKAKAEHYRLMSDIGVYSINDIRQLEDINPINGGDEHYVQLNRIPIEQIEDYYKDGGKTIENKQDEGN